jgi:hypothetical protein
LGPTQASIEGKSQEGQSNFCATLDGFRTKHYLGYRNAIMVMQETFWKSFSKYAPLEVLWNYVDR